jgi:hypothetical protein
MGILIFKGLTARRLFNSFDIKGLSKDKYNYVCLSILNGTFYNQIICQFLSQISDKKDSFNYYNKISTLQ